MQILVLIQTPKSAPSYANVTDLHQADQGFSGLTLLCILIRF